ncbi:hypothetical protein HRbin28_02030 [bacterium HR28]|jgi:hypothetical protein|uniref:Uncharacterized protein n=1 Tax=Thermomicrobium roseum TaxID=500 RepID=A0A7C1K0C5_THERO|nr:hypothetical protein HRbin28_02030 [bacterium HR28]
MRWSFFAAWLALLVVGGASAMVFWSSFNRVVGGFGTGRDWVGLVLGIGGVFVTLLLARWVLMQVSGREEVKRERPESDEEEAGDRLGRSEEHVESGTAR